MEEQPSRGTNARRAADTDRPCRSPQDSWVSELGNTSASSRRERIPSLLNTLRRCHSTVRGLRKSRAPISGFERPSRARSSDLPLLCGQIVARLDGPLAGLLARTPEALCALARRTPPSRSPMNMVVGRAQLLARVDPPTLAAQPLAVKQVRPRELGTKPGAAQSIDRLAIGALGVLALTEQRPRAREDAQPPIAVADARRLGQSLERLAGKPGLPGPGGRLDQLRKRPPGEVQLRRLRRWLAGPPPAASS